MKEILNVNTQTGHGWKVVKNVFLTYVPFNRLHLKCEYKLKMWI